MFKLDSKTTRANIGRVVIALIGGEEFTLIPLPRKPIIGNRLGGYPMPEDVRGFGSAVIEIENVEEDKNDFVPAQLVDERCRELFGFGLVRRDQCVLLKRRKSPSDLFHRKGYAYHTDSKGRMMIQGDYDNELNIAYIKMLGEPMEVKLLTVCGPDPIGHQYVANGSALIYLSDLEVLAKWCGDKVIINGNKASIKSGLSS